MMKMGFFNEKKQWDFQGVERDFMIRYEYWGWPNNPPEGMHDLFYNVFVLSIIVCYLGQEHYYIPGNKWWFCKWLRFSDHLWLIWSLFLHRHYQEEIFESIKDPIVIWLLQVFMCSKWLGSGEIFLLTEWIALLLLKNAYFDSILKGRFWQLWRTNHVTKWSSLLWYLLPVGEIKKMKEIGVIRTVLWQDGWLEIWWMTNFALFDIYWYLNIFTKTTPTNFKCNFIWFLIFMLTCDID